MGAHEVTDAACLERARGLEVFELEEYAAGEILAEANDG